MLATTDLHRFTVEEFRAMAEQGLIDGDARVELIDGLVVDMSPIGTLHAYLVNLVASLYARGRPEQPADAPFVQVQQPIELGPRYQLVPDVSVVLGPIGRYRDHIPRPDEILEVVEVADSSLAKDTTDKLDAYRRAGIPAIVVIDVQGREVQRWTASPTGPAGYAHTVAVGHDEWLPGVTVDALFA